MGSIFQMHEKIVDDYQKYVQSFLSISDEEIRKYLDTHLILERLLWPDALIQVNPSYESVATIEDLASSKILHPTVAEIFRTENNKTLNLYRHQVDAIKKAHENQSYVVTSGTGSGKSLAYLIPIFDAILKTRSTDPKVRAIIVYPMNALVNSQYEALTRYAEGYEKRTGKPCPVTFKRYTGQDKDSDKDLIKQNPPHILLTNYVMLELMLVRPDEGKFVDATTSGIQFLVFDELHTYRGRQGADVALLIRRLRNRCGNPDLQCIGTSATMISGRTTTAAERRAEVATFATDIFGVQLSPSEVIEETLRRVTKAPAHVKKEILAANVKAQLPQTVSDFIASPFSSWVELNFGIEEEEGGRYRRRVPITLKEGADKLAEQTGLTPDLCRKQLNALFLLGSELKQSDGTPVFGFKLHQFISQGRTIYSTLQDPASRFLTLDGQYFAPGANEKRLLYPLKFCRTCGQEYYLVSRDVKARMLFPDGENGDANGGTAESGYLMISPLDDRLKWDTADLPPEWVEIKGKGPKAKKNRLSHVPQALWVNPDGSFTDAATERPNEGAVKAWFQPRPLMLCLSCGEYYSRKSQSDFRKLTGLASEGRSTCTTVMSLSAYQNAPVADIQDAARKVLSFTDNRQDASLQSGHFNDFVQVSFLRGAIFQALKKHRQLKYDQIADQVFTSAGLSLKDIAQDPSLDERSTKALEVKNSFRAFLEYRVYEDLQRGWRVIQPNLEQCGLLSFDYAGLHELCSNETKWKDVTQFRDLSPREREEIIHNLLDFFRKKLAIRTSSFDPNFQQALSKQVYHNISTKWTMDFFDKKRLIQAGRFVLPGEKEGVEFARSLGETSLIGQYLKRTLTFSHDYQRFMAQLIDTLCSAGILCRIQDRKHESYQLDASVLLWNLGDGVPKRDPIYSRKAVSKAFQVEERKANEYFTHFYQEVALGLSGVESHEHTAQISYDHREKWETKFRKGELAALFCSPTMELGIDISDLKIVHMRNVPPTPANYAQRSGRAGRTGDPALVMTYCAAGSGHDQYFFHHRDHLVAGSVRAPKIDVSNEDLIKAHIHALWLSYVNLPMGSSIADIVDLGLDKYPLKVNVNEQIQLSEARLKQCTEDAREILTQCGLEYEEASWYNEEWLRSTLRNSPKEFNTAFIRFRDLFEAADILWNNANNQLRIPSKDKQVMIDARKQWHEADRQKQLLMNTTSRREDSDFYPYRYLASEGFLPGYNFPRLPIRAFIPTSATEGEYISRPRFLAVTEFGPSAMLYHEGTKYEVRRLIPPPGGLEILRHEAKICKRCGHFQSDKNIDICEYCGIAFDASTCEFVSLMEMTNVSTVCRERITSDEEERRRFGYVVTSHFQFTLGPDGKRRVVESIVKDSQGTPILRLTYGPAASLFRINHGWRRQLQRSFYIDMASGTWESTPEELEDMGEAPPADARPEPVKLFVKETMNILLVNFLGPADEWTEQLQASLQYALQRGMEQKFQVDESEIASERIGEGEHSALLYWESSEGGLGVLRHIASKPDAISQVAEEALKRCHFDPETLKDKEPQNCSHACYECLLSFSNQRDYRNIDRHLIPTLLSRLSSATTFRQHPDRDYDAQYHWLYEQTDPRSELERLFLKRIYETKRLLPDEAQIKLGDYYSQPDFVYSSNILIFCDGSVHDKPDQMRVDEDSRNGLRDKGYRIIVIRYDQNLEEQLKSHKDIFGRGSKPT